VNKTEARRWIENQREAARVEARNAARTWGSSEQAIARALGLIALYGELHGWPPVPDAIGDREDMAAWDRFARLRRRKAPR
jgi:hypothetical protein